MTAKRKISENVSSIFSRYLKSKGLRQTPERFAILSEIYLSDEHFDLKTLGERLAKKRFLVSRATLYNTIDLLLECGLIRRNKFGKSKTLFEKTKNRVSHGHLVLTDVQEILEFSDEEISEFQKHIENLYNVEIQDHSLIFYGKRKKNDDEKN